MALSFGSDHIHAPLEYGLSTVTRQSASYATWRAKFPQLPPHLKHLAPDAIPPPEGVNALGPSEHSLPSSTATSLYNSPQIPAWTMPSDASDTESPYSTQSSHLATSPPQVGNTPTAAPLYHSQAQAYEESTSQLNANSSTALPNLSDIPHGGVHAPLWTFTPPFQNTNTFFANSAGVTMGLPSEYEFTFRTQQHIVYPPLGASPLMQYGQPSTGMGAGYPASLGPFLPLAGQEAGLTQYAGANYSAFSETNDILPPTATASLEGEDYYNSSAYTGTVPTNASLMTSVLPEVHSTYSSELSSSLQQQSFDATVVEGETLAPGAEDTQSFDATIALLCQVLGGDQLVDNGIAPVSGDPVGPLSQTENVVAPLAAPQPTYHVPSYQQPQEQQRVAGPSRTRAKRSRCTTYDHARPHKRPNPDRPRYYCEICEMEMFSDRRRHHEKTRKHLGATEGAFLCPNCRKDYSRKDALKRHFHSKHPHLLAYPELLEPRKDKVFPDPIPDVSGNL